jgi:hypothetical protein
MTKLNPRRQKNKIVKPLKRKMYLNLQKKKEGKYTLTHIFGIWVSTNPHGSPDPATGLWLRLAWDAR